MIVINRTLSIFTYKAKSGKFYKMAYYNGKFNFVHFKNKEKFKNVIYCKSKRNEKFIKYKGDFDIENGVIII